MNHKDHCSGCSGGGLVPALGCACDGNGHTCTPLICAICDGTGLALDVGPCPARVAPVGRMGQERYARMDRMPAEPENRAQPAGERAVGPLTHLSQTDRTRLDEHRQTGQRGDPDLRVWTPAHWLDAPH